MKPVVLMLLASLLLTAGRSLAAPHAGHVVVIVWDGMRPDFVTPEAAPTLTALAHNGVFFRHNHSAFPTSTNVNGAVLATGDYPGHNGIISNQEFRPAIDPLKHFDTADFPALDGVDPQINAKFIATPTIAEIVQKAGFRTAVAGSKPVAQLADRSRLRESDIATQSVVLYRGHVLPKSAKAKISAQLGPFPKRGGSLPNESEDAWTTRALTDVLWKNEVPKFSLLWLSEPDLSQHETAPGSETSRDAMKSDDDNLARVLETLRAKKALATTDILVVSDHGFSTIDHALDVAEQLRAAGFDAVRAFTRTPKPGQILVVSLGGSCELYVIGHDRDLTQKLVDFLQRSDFAGVILTREEMEGTFTLADLRLASDSAPDIIVSSRWNDEPNSFGTRGKVASDIGKGLGQGTHSTFSPHDVRNLLVACGPDFRRGWIDNTATGNIDVAPTVLYLLGLTPPEKMDGRVLAEALRRKSQSPRSKTRSLHAERDLGSSAGTWQQTLRLTSVGGVTYFDEGNGGRSQPKP